MKPMVLIAMLLTGCSGASSAAVDTGDPNGARAPFTTEGPDAGGSSSSGDDVDAGSSPGDHDAAPDAPTLGDGAAPDAAPDPCPGIASSASAAGLNCGAYQGCDLGPCSPVEVCGGSGFALTDAPNVCGHACKNDDALVQQCNDEAAKRELHFVSAWAVNLECRYAYRVGSSGPEMRPSGIAGCMDTTYGGVRLLCCP